MMWWWNDGLTWWGLLGMAIAMVVFWALIIWVIVALGSYLTSSRTHLADHAGRPHSAEDILRERFARGEVDADEYRTRLELLRSSSPHGGSGRSDAA